MIRIQHEDFNVGDEYEALKHEADGDGAIVTFTGLVRDFNDEGLVTAINLEHYPGMTEKSLMQICIEAGNRWDLGSIRLIHRIGVIKAEEQIVFVGITSKRRKSAFEACEFIMDYLKTSVPIWKQECTVEGMKWVESKSTDEAAMQRWFS